MSAGKSSACLAQTYATAVIRMIPNPDQIAYTVPAGIARSGNDRSQNVATKPTIDRCLATAWKGFRMLRERWWRSLQPGLQQPNTSKS